jgi:hypothetical protein
MSKDALDRMIATGKAVADWVKSLEWKRCMNPDCQSARALTTHHMVPKSSSRRLAREPANFLRLCLKCHEDAEAYKLPLSVQLCWKALYDPGHYDLPLLREHCPPGRRRAELMDMGEIKQ